MTSSTTTKAASNGGTTTEREHGLTVLRTMEAKALIDVANEAITETGWIGHALFEAIFAKERTASEADLQRKLEEALICWQTADHYLRMLGSVLADYDPQLDSLLAGSDPS